MKKSIKIIIVMIIAILASGCTIKNQKYYDSLATIIIAFYKTDIYDVKKIDKNDMAIVSEYLSQLTHKDQKINVSDFINKDWPSIEENSKEIYVEDGICYMQYSSLKEKFDDFYLENDQSVIDAFYTVTCNGYYATLSESDFYPDYESTKKNPEHNYILLDKYKENDSYIYIYRSTYDGIGLKLKLEVENKKLINIITENVNVDLYSKETE